VDEGRNGFPAGAGEGAAAPPPRPDLASGVGAPAARRSRRWPWIVAAFVLVNAGVGAFVLTRPDANGMPDEVAGLPRLHTDAARSFEDFLASVHVGGVSIRGAMYGNADRPELLLERFVDGDDPFQGLPVETVLGQAASGLGIGMGGGELDEDATVSDTRDGADYACAPFRGPALPQIGDVTVVCVFSGGGAGFLLDLRTSLPSEGIDDAQAARDAILGAG